MFDVYDNWRRLMAAGMSMTETSVRALETLGAANHVLAARTSIMETAIRSPMPQAVPDVMALMTRPAPDPASDEAGFVEHSVAFARRIAGTAHPFDEDAYRALIRDEIQRAYVPGGFGRQIAAIAVTGDRRSQLATIRVPTLVVHGTDDPLHLPVARIRPPRFRKQSIC